MELRTVDQLAAQHLPDGTSHSTTFMREAPNLANP
jgi:hypothetical protein